MWQHPTPPAPAPAPSIAGVFSDLQAKAAAAVPGLVTAFAVFAVFYLIAHVGQRVIALTAPRVKADTGVVLLLSRVYYYGVLTFGVSTALGTAGMNVSALVAGLGLTGFANWRCAGAWWRRSSAAIGSSRPTARPGWRRATS